MKSTLKVTTPELDLVRITKIIANHKTRLEFVCTVERMLLKVWY